MTAPRLEVFGLTKHFGPVVAVDNLSFEAQAGTVTGFLGPNGAGKTTTLRILLGLASATGGTALVNGVPYRELLNPTRVVGAVLESSGFHPGRTARSHLRTIATATGIARARVDEVLAFVGLADDGDRRVSGYSMGMRQRLELARALLGDPEILVLDEPANGLDPQGIAWLRQFLREFASQGKVVLISSHLLAEAAQTVDEVIVLAGGRLAGKGPLPALLAGARRSVRVRARDPRGLVAALAAAEMPARLEPGGLVVVEGPPAEAVGEVIARAAIVISEMTSSSESLEQLFFAMTEHAPPPPPPSPPPPDGPRRGRGSPQPWVRAGQAQGSPPPPPARLRAGGAEG